jgi:hypothetical protein
MLQPYFLKKHIEHIHNAHSYEKYHNPILGPDTIKRLISYPNCRSVEVINNSARPGSNHREVNYIITNNKMILILKRTLRCDNDEKIKQ